MKLQKLFVFALVSLAATIGQAKSQTEDSKYFLDLPSRLIVNTVEAPKNQTASDTIWVRDINAHQIESDNLGTKVPKLSRQKKDLVATLEEYQGTHVGHMVKVLDPTTNKATEAKVQWIFANDSMRVQITYYKSTISRVDYDMPVSALLDRQVESLENLKLGVKACAIENDGKIKAGKELEIEALWNSGKVEVSTSEWNEFTQAVGFSGKRTTEASNLQPCE